MIENKYGIRFTIPDGPPEKQLKMVKSLREIMITFAKAASEEPNLGSIDEVIRELETQIEEPDNE